MRPWICGALAAGALALGAAPAAAGEERISTAEIEQVAAAGGWVWWAQAKGWASEYFLWHGGPVQPSSTTSPLLGTDRDGRAVALEEHCTTSTDCSVLSRVLPDGETTHLYTETPPRHPTGFDDSGGTFVIGLRGPYPEHKRTIWLRRPGGTLHRFSNSRAGALSLTNRVLVNYYSRVGENRLVGMRLTSPPHPRLLVRYDTERNQSRPGLTRRLTDPVADGGYAYWLETSFRNDANWVRIPGSEAARVLRVKLTDAHPAVEALSLRPSAALLAVTRGRLYYAGSGGLYEAPKPKFQRTGEKLPLEY
jgi:hypothetical protein